MTETIIQRPLEMVAAFAADPANVTRWYSNIQTVEWLTMPPPGVGSRIRFTASFLGRRLAYTYEIVEWVPTERLVMRTSEGPFPMETSYYWHRINDVATHMRLRNRGQPSGWAKVLIPVMSFAVRRENRKDLARLKQILEAAG